MPRRFAWNDLMKLKENRNYPFAFTTKNIVIDSLSEQKQLMLFGPEMLAARALT